MAQSQIVWVTLFGYRHDDRLEHWSNALNEAYLHANLPAGAL
ncbi:hypothetical protein TevJSym_ae00770 [endosymbiont of Tevnia jerichonana (vent Tica)]|uniref:Uncharacterized protein n=1 Tax=endosymbiont of Tevnia jerichonana (vent Tica) TaxID=1049564 RepID=G2FDD4_9GAMM|nr:hypothetical protein TevJSym_ae00770 [endosymbiont of Tevnia jerichonana (vent Tica)]